MCPAFRTDTDILRTSEDAYERFILQHLKHYGLFSGRESTVQDGLSSHRKWSGERYHHSSLTANRHSPVNHDSNLEEEGEEEEEEQEEEEVRGPGGRPFSVHLGQPLRTTQLVMAFDGERSVPRLRDPPDLCAITSSSSPFQGVRWPIECEVIKEPAIHHMEWDPLEPEPFYQATGQEMVEMAPVPVGNEKGSVVFCIEPATKSSYFTCSRVGGSRGPVKSATPGATWEEGPALTFESRFESGNLQKAVQVGLHDYELTLRPDMYTAKHTQWFYFRVKHMSVGVNYRFTIVNLMKASSLYGVGMRPLFYSERAARETGVGWRRTGSNIRYYRNQLQAEQDDSGAKPLHSLTWTCQFPYDSDTCYLAHCYPYTYSQLQRYLGGLTSDPATSAYCKLRVLCRSLAGNAVHVLTVTSPGGGGAERRARRAVVVTARVHPGETNGSWMMQGFLDFLLGPSDDARLLRDTFVFKVVPMLNPDGVVVGNYRCSLAGRDLNRNYRTLLRDSFPCVWHTRNMVKRLVAERDVVLYCDFHGHSRKNNVFMYGCDNRQDAALRLHERVFPLMMSKNANDKFSFRSCKFRVQKSKEGTGRIVMWRLGVRNSYTMESTFGGSTLGSRKGTHFTTRDLKSLGYYFCDTLLDYCDPDPTKTSRCLAELGALLRQEVKQRLGQELDSDGSLYSVSLSDIESSTSGSNSTESDGLPAHLLNRPMEPIPVKKKHLRSRKERDLLRQERHRLRQERHKTSHRNTKHMESVPALEEEATTKTQEKTVAALRERQRREKVPFIVKVRSQSGLTWVPNPPTQIGVIGHVTLWQKDEPEKNDDLKALTAAYLCKQPRHQGGQSGAHTDERAQPGPETFDPLQSAPQRHLLTVTPIQQRGPSVPIPTCKVHIHTTIVQQAFGPAGPHPGMRGRNPALISAAHRSAPGVLGLQCRVVSESVPSRDPAKSHGQRTPCGERQGQAARGNTRCCFPEPPSSTDTSEPRRRSPSRDSTAGRPADVSQAAPLREQEQRGGASGLENLLTDARPFLPDLRTTDLTGRSHGRPWGDQSGVEIQRTGLSKRDLLKGGVIRRAPGGECVPAGRYREHRLSQQTLQEKDQDVGELPQVSRAAPPLKEQPARLQRDDVRRLQKLSLAGAPRLPPSTERRRGRPGPGEGPGDESESGPGSRMVHGPEGTRGVNSRPSGSAPPLS